MMTNQKSPLLEKLIKETARIPWHELQRFFAQGRVLLVADELDLPTVAEKIVQDSVAGVEKLVKANKVSHVSDKLAKSWYDEDAEVWAVVVAPYVLVQST